MIPMDVILIEQVLINLMENSIQHGGTTTRVEMQLRKEGENARLRLRTTDRELRGRCSRSSSRDICRTTGTDRRRAAEYGHRAFGLHEHCAGARRHDAGGNWEIGGALFSFTLPLEERNYEDPREDSGN